MKSTIMKWMAAMFVFVLAFASTAAFAQTSRGIVTGTVTDPSGAIVSGAKVTARNTLTGLERTTVVNDTGDYELALLPITGAYTLGVSKEGFQTQELTGIVLEVDQRARLDVTMKIGSISEPVGVEELAPVVNTEFLTPWGR